MKPEDILNKKNTKTPKVDHLQNNPSVFSTFAKWMIIGIISLIVLIQIGFFKSYIRFFPKFNDANVEGFGTVEFNTTMHFHGMIMMGWVLMLLVQPILIRKGKMNLHRQVGRLSYVLAPLVLVSLFLANQDGYHRILKSVGEPQAVGLLALTFPSIVFFAVLYFLAIRYRHRPALHMRFMCSTAFLFIPPALDRALIHYWNLPGYDVGSVIQLAIIGAVTITDSAKTRRLSPFALVFAFELLHKTLWHLRDTDFWQAVGTVIAKLF